MAKSTNPAGQAFAERMKADPSLGERVRQLLTTAANRIVEWTVVFERETGEPAPMSVEGWYTLAAKSHIDPNRILDGTLELWQVESIARGVLASKREAYGIEPKTAESGESAMEPEAQAILFVKRHLKETGKLPSKVAIAKLLEVDRRTLYNWTAFKVAYATMKRELSKHRPPPKGSKSKGGNLEAWRD